MRAGIDATRPVSRRVIVASRGNNTYRRLSGRLHLNGRSSLLETTEGKLIYLTASDDLAHFDGCDVVVEGEMSGSDRLSLTWIGLAAA